MAENVSTTLERGEADLRVVDAAAILAIVDTFITGTIGRELVSSGEVVDFGLDIRQALQPVEA